MSIEKMLDLQLFAEGGEGGGNGATVGTPADDGQAAQAELEALGVPRHKITERAKNAVAKQKRQMAKAQPQSQAPRAAAEGQTAAEPTGQEAESVPAEAAKEGSAPQRMTWQEIMKDPEYNAEMQKLIRARLKGMDALRPALEMLAGRYNIDVSDPSKMDEAALGRAIMEDDGLWEEKAAAMGVEPDVARRLDQLERFEAQQKVQQQRTVEEEAIRQHFQTLDRQAQELKASYPQFDLMTELQNPVFRRMTSPNGGVDVKTAYYAIHHEEIQKAATENAARQAAEQVAASVQANRSRPVEHGSGGQAASTTALDIRNMSEAQRKEIREQVKRGQIVRF